MRKDQKRKQELHKQLSDLVTTIHTEFPEWMESTIHAGKDASVHIAVATNRHGDEYYGVRKGFFAKEEEIRCIKHGQVVRPYGYLTASEFAEKNDIPHGTIQQWITRDKLPAIKIGNTWFVKRSERIPVRNKLGGSA